MNVALALRLRLVLCGTNHLDCERNGYRLSIMRLADSPRCLAFALSEAKPRGWWPVVSGRVDERNRLIITEADPEVLPSLPELIAFVLGIPEQPAATKRTGPTAAPKVEPAHER